MPSKLSVAFYEKKNKMICRTSVQILLSTSAPTAISSQHFLTHRYSMYYHSHAHQLRDLYSLACTIALF